MQLIAGTPFREEQEFFFENLPPKRKIFSSFYFSRMKIEELFLVPPLDPLTPKKYKNIFFFIYSTKRRRKNILKLFFYSQAQKCGLLHLYASLPESPWLATLLLSTIMASYFATSGHISAISSWILMGKKRKFVYSNSTI